MVKAQSNKISSALFSGTLVIGYVDKGAFVNVLGPNIKCKIKNFEAQLGLLPSLKLKQDNNSPRNSFVTPSLGFGLTLKSKQINFQFPMYYTSKTLTQNGKWNLGLGIGINFK